MQNNKNICVDCKKEFFLTDRDLEFYKEKGWALPKRCKSCRDKRKKEENSPFGQISRKMRLQEKGSNFLSKNNIKYNDE